MVGGHASGKTLDAFQRFDAVRTGRDGPWYREVPSDKNHTDDENGWTLVNNEERTIQETEDFG